MGRSCDKKSILTFFIKHFEEKDFTDQLTIGPIEEGTDITSTQLKIDISPKRKKSKTRPDTRLPKSRAGGQGQ